MGHGSHQPYMYDPPSSVDTFDPRAFSRKSWAPPPPPKPKKEGPLLEPSINFNKHPDSYLIVPYGNLNAKPLSTKTKKAIKWVRWVQLALRAIELVGAVGTLVMAICVKGTKSTEGWAMRIPPGIDILSILYAIYHLFRPAKGRTPTSSASYHFFAGCIDAGVIPFYVFTSLLANNSYHESSGTTGRWSTFFDSENTTNLIFMMLWLLGTVMAGLHFISLTFDLYLVVIFRRIARLPPDMNPLEDNLTSRSKKNKHKYKDSDATLAIADTFDKKRLSDMSQSTLTVSHPSPDRGSKVRDPLLPDVGARNISFFHTRNDSNASFNPHNPRTARLSRSQFEMEEKGRMYQQPFSSRASRIDVASEREPTLAELQASLVNRSAVSLAPPPRNPARDSAHSFVSALSTPKETFNGGRTDSPVSPIADDSKSDNSFVAKDTASSFRTSKTNIRPAHGRSKSQYDFDLDTNSGANSPNPYNGGTVRRPNSYQPLPQSSNIHIDTPSPAPPMRPLAMNPPSPMYAPDLHSTHGVIEKERDTDSFSLDSGSHYSTTTDGQSVSAVSSAALPPTVPMHAHGRNNSNSIGTNLRSSATPKGKYYGDLASAQLGIRGDSNSPVRLEPPSASIDVQDFAAPPPDVPRYSATAAGKKGEVKSVEKASRPRSWLGGGLAASYDYSVGSGSEKGSPNPNLYSADRSPYLQQGGWGGANANASASAAKSSYTSSPASAYANGKGHEKNGEWRQDRSTPTRVVSRSGVEYEGANVVGVGGGRRRDVSGKIAEEGRGGWGGFGGPGSGMRGRKASAGVVQG